MRYIGFRVGPTILLIAIVGTIAVRVRPNTTDERAEIALDPSLENVEAFARLYGHVRFFHPSDEAASVDWERLAILGVGRVASAATPAELERALRELFLIAPAVRIYREAGSLGSAWVPSERANRDRLVAWQHHGGGFAPWSIYSSMRTNRPGMLGGRELTRMVQGVPVGELRGQQVRLRAAVRTEVDAGMGNARLTLMVVRSGAQGFTDEMSDRPITGSDWRVHEIVGRVDEDATGLIIGMSMWGSGKAWFDAFELSASEDGTTWRDIPLQNAEMDVDPTGIVRGWAPMLFAPGSQHFEFTASTEQPFRGGSSAILRVDQPLELFDALPDPDAVPEIELGRGLRASIPLVLPSREGRTVPTADPGPLSDLVSELNEVDLSDPDLNDPALRLGNVVIAWNVLRHFYPYQAEVEIEWDSMLRATLVEAAGASGPTGYLSALQRMMSALHDGHACVDHRHLSGRYALPVALEWVEEQVVVTASRDTTKVRPGDQVLTIDGRDVAELVLDEMAFASGHEGLRRSVAIASLGRGEAGSQARVRVRRGASEEEVTLTRDQPFSPSPVRLPPITELEEGVYYVDLVRVNSNLFATWLEPLEKARGIIFDVRGYPGSDDAFHILRHLSDEPISRARMCIPMVLYPNWNPAPECDEKGPELHEPLLPRLEGPFVFLTNSQAVSFAEVIMGAVDFHRLGPIIGQPTAGANGNQSGITLPGGIQLAWTGMIVRKLDGSPHHAVGILPTVHVERTIEGIREGRGEYLEMALRVLRNHVE